MTKTTEFEFEGWYWCNAGEEIYFKGSSDMYYYTFGIHLPVVGCGGVTKDTIKLHRGNEEFEVGYIPEEYLM